MKKNGFISVEGIITMAVALIVALELLQGISTFRKVSKNIAVSNSKDKEIYEIGESIRMSLDSFQVNYSFDSKDTEKLLDVKNLPMAWDSGIQSTVKECPQCPGRYGFVIRPLEEQRGLYLVTMRLTYQTWS